jgi:hypothetical protein
MVSILFAALATLGAAMPGMPQMASGPAPDFSKTCGAVPKSDKLLNPPELVSQNGVLSVRLTMAGDSNPIFASMCYFWTYPSKNGPVTLSDPPTLHVKQGDKLIVELVNTLHVPNGSQPPPALAVQRGGYSEGEMDMSKGLPCGQPMTPPTPPPPDPKTGRIYGYHRTPWNETNMHFHGLNVSPKAPSDDVVNVLICPVTSFVHANEYTYVLDIPADEPPGNYWYHPHPHGESDHQLLSGLTGVIIVDSPTKSIPDTLPNREIVVRDQGPAPSAPAALGRRTDARLASHGPSSSLPDRTTTIAPAVIRSAIPTNARRPTESSGREATLGQPHPVAGGSEFTLTNCPRHDRLGRDGLLSPDQHLVGHDPRRRRDGQRQPGQHHGGLARQRSVGLRERSADVSAGRLRSRLRAAGGTFRVLSHRHQSGRSDPLHDADHRLGLLGRHHAAAQSLRGQRDGRQEQADDRARSAQRQPRQTALQRPVQGDAGQTSYLRLSPSTTRRATSTSPRSATRRRSRRPTWAARPRSWSSPARSRIGRS